jgi:hypothetical protein
MCLPMTYIIKTQRSTIQHSTEKETSARLAWLGWQDLKVNGGKRLLFHHDNLHPLVNKKPKVSFGSPNP